MKFNFRHFLLGSSLLLALLLLIASFYFLQPLHQILSERAGEGGLDLAALQRGSLIMSLVLLIGTSLLFLLSHKLTSAGFSLLYFLQIIMALLLASLGAAQ
jgi:hypothetical protein